jgi:hypothetical protein
MSKYEYNRHLEEEANNRYLEELEEQRRETIRTQCNQGRHNWKHYYGGLVACSVCGEDVEDAK